MGQYHKILNLDKREYLMPHDLGYGLKLWEFVPWEKGPMTILGLLLACSNGRGGGDFNYQYTPQTAGGFNINNMPPELSEMAQQFIGHWAGDRIAIVGDYAEDGDLRRDYDDAGRLYGLCMDGEESRARQNQWLVEQGEKPIADNEWFTNISPLARAVMTEVFGITYSGDGWLKVHIPDEAA